VDFVLIVGITALLTISVHALEGAAYLQLRALNNKRAAMLYSLRAMTTYGHANIHLSPHWELVGAISSRRDLHDCRVGGDDQRPKGFEVVNIPTPTRCAR
jgi:hypothetical protein